MTVDSAPVPVTYTLPRQVASQLGDDGLPACLLARTRTLRDGGRLAVPELAFSEELKSSLLAARRSGSIVRGIEGAADALGAEQRGLELLKKRLPQGERISRLLLTASDGSANFYRKVDHLLERHAPRVWGCIIDADSLSLGSLLFGPGATARLVLVGHKSDVCRILLALVNPVHR